MASATGVRRDWLHRESRRAEARRAIQPDCDEGLEPLLNPRPDFVRLALRVEDETGKGVLGPPPTQSSAAGWESFDLLFFPRNELGNYVGQIPPVPRWRLTVSPTGEMPVTNGIGFWLLAVIVLLLLLVAVVCAVSVNRQAIRLSELQSDFVANVSHQLRTPLAMLSGAAETLGLERVRSPAKVKEYADIVQAQTQRLSVLVDRDTPLPSRGVRGTRAGAAEGRSVRAHHGRGGAVPGARERLGRDDVRGVRRAWAGGARRSGGAGVCRREPAGKRRQHSGGAANEVTVSVVGEPRLRRDHRARSRHRHRAR